MRYLLVLTLGYLLGTLHYGTHSDYTSGFLAAFSVADSQCRSQILDNYLTEILGDK